MMLKITLNSLWRPPWKVKWSSTSSRIENYEKDDTINDCKNMESFIVGLGTVQTLKAN